MAPSELDSFYFKFKNLLLSEKDATLTLKSEGGRTNVTLCVDLGHVLSEPGPLPPHHARNGNSRSRRREKRAELRQLAAADAEKVDTTTAVDTSEKDTPDVDPSEAVEVVDATVNVTENCNIQIREVADELCSDEQYEKRVEEPPEEILECFRIVDNDSKKPEDDFVNDVVKTLDSKLKNAKFK